MKTTELKKMGIDELSLTEAKSINGGNPFAGAIARFMGWAVDCIVGPSCVDVGSCCVDQNGCEQNTTTTACY